MKSDRVASVCWFDAEQAMVWALQAYYAARREVEPHQGELDPETWASAGGFAHEFHAALTRRVSLAAFRRGIAPDSGCASELLGWPSGDDPEFEKGWLDGLRKCGLCVDENAVDNRATPGVR